jgi:hypothetical protein
MATRGGLDMPEYKVCDVRLVSSSFLLFFSPFPFHALISMQMASDVTLL